MDHFRLHVVCIPELNPMARPVTLHPEALAADARSPSATLSAVLTRSLSTRRAFPVARLDFRNRPLDFLGPRSAHMSRFNATRATSRNRRGSPGGEDHLRGISPPDVISFSAQFHHDARPLSGRGAGNVGGGAECPGQRGNSPLDEGDDVCRHLEGSSMPVLRGGPHRLLPHVGGRARNAGSPRRGHHASWTTPSCAT